MNLKYICDSCHQDFETKSVFNGFCPWCGHDYMTCLNFNEWDKMTKYGEKIQAALDRMWDLRKEKT